MTTPSDLQKCFEANSLAPFFALKYAPAAMGKLASKGNYPNAVPKDQKYGSIIVVSSVASTYGGCWGPCYTMSSHAALGVVQAGVAVLKGSGVRINCISPGQIDVGIDLKGFDMRGMKSQLPPANLQSAESQKEHIGLERAGLPSEVARVAGFLASGFSSYMTGANSKALFWVIASSLKLLFELRDMLHEPIAQFSTLSTPQTCLIPQFLIFKWAVLTPKCASGR